MEKPIALVRNRTVLERMTKKLAYIISLKAVVSLTWCFPVLLGQDRCIYEFHLQNRKMFLELLASWSSCWACFAWPLELYLPAHSISRTPLYRESCWWWITKVTLHHAWSPHAALVNALRLFFSPVSFILMVLVASCLLMTGSNGRCSLSVTNIFLIEACCNLFPTRRQILLWNVWLWIY